MTWIFVHSLLNCLLFLSFFIREFLLVLKRNFQLECSHLKHILHVSGATECFLLWWWEKQLAFRVQDYQVYFTRVYQMLCCFFTSSKLRKDNVVFLSNILIKKEKEFPCQCAVRRLLISEPSVKRPQWLKQ